LHLRFEETCLEQEPEWLSQMISAVKSYGVQASLDRFGNQHAHLTRLTDCPFDRVILDKSFLKNLEQDERKRYMLQATVSVLKDVNIKTDISGADDMMTAEIAKAAGVTYATGALAGEEIPASRAYSDLRKNIQEREEA
jgi:EAL domain-containing protein (putative c-di-GMP-specific phosphodiesterase class I)